VISLALSLLVVTLIVIILAVVLVGVDVSLYWYCRLASTPCAAANLTFRRSEESEESRVSAGSREDTRSVAEEEVPRPTQIQAPPN
jgi:hypothetical protein